MIAEVIGVRPVRHDRDSALTRDRGERVPQLRLAEVAAIRRIRGVPRVIHFVGRNLEYRHAELPRDLASPLPLLARIRRAPPDDRENALSTQDTDGDAREIRGIDAAAEPD